MTGVHIPANAWVLVGDGEKALVLQNEGDATYPNLRKLRVFEHENPPTHEQGADRPGRLADSGIGPRSAVDDADWHKLAKTEFAREVAHKLYAAAHAGKFDNLIVVAPPHVLGDLRKTWHAEVAGRVIAEVDKTLTNHPIGEIEKLLTKG